MDDARLSDAVADERLIGNISQWGEVKKKTKDRSRSKAQDSVTANTEATSTSARGGRGRGSSEASRGGRGRGGERGRGAGRSFRGSSTLNGNRGHNAEKDATDAHGIPTSVITPSDSASQVVKPDTADGDLEKSHEASSATPDPSWEMVTPPEMIPTPSAEVPKPSSKPDGTRSWASIFNKPTPAPLRPKATHASSSGLPLAQDSYISDVATLGVDEPGLPPPGSVEESVVQDTITPSVTVEPASDITPSKDELTETNLEQVLDTSAPAPIGTAASTAASTQDLRTAAGSATPLLSLKQDTLSRPPMGGYATSAYKATNTPGRSASFQRRILEQQEAVVMPGNHAVDRAAVQFGSMGLNGTADDLDVDDVREEAETRTQPPQHSPIAPRAALPPAPQPTIESLPTPRQAPGLLPAAPQSTSQDSSQPSAVEQATAQHPIQGSYPYSQFNNRYGPQVTQPEPSAPVQKAYEPFGQQAQQPHTQQHQYDSYPSQSQSQVQPPPQTQQPQLGGYSSAGNDYSSFYTSDSQRNAYHNYYGNYAQQAQQNQQDAGGSQQRAGSAFGGSASEQPSQYATSQMQQQQTQARYGQAHEPQTSGHSTPNPSLPGQQPSSQSQPSHQLPQQQNPGQAGGQHGGFPYGHPYYSNPYYSYANQVSHHSYGRERPMYDDVRRYDDQYLTHNNNQFGYGANQGGYGAGPFAGAAGKQGMYGQPQPGYGMSPQSSYEHHSASPANVGGFGQQQQSLPARDTAASGGVGVYGRAGSTQPSESQQQHGASTQAFGSMPDVFNRSQSGYSGLAQSLTQQHGSTEDPMRSYGDSAKGPSGPSPALGQPGARPPSVTNNIQGQGTLPPPQSQSQQAYGGYPNHMNQQMHGQQNSQYGSGLGGLGGQHQSAAQSHQGSQYGAGYGAGYGGSYYGNNNRGGWGGNYGH